MNVTLSPEATSVPLSSQESLALKSSQVKCHSPGKRDGSTQRKPQGAALWGRVVDCGYAYSGPGSFMGTRKNHLALKHNHDLVGFIGPTHADSPKHLAPPALAHAPSLV